MMQQTMGQRISARRKMMNLSQETLAEQLEVSRQAVSKWESDGTIPEIDKLIALGRIFDVSVGWLLGTESEPKPVTDQLSQKQLELVQELIRKSLPQKKWLNILVGSFAALAIIVGGLGILSAQQKFAQLSNEQLAVQEQLAELSADNQRTDSRIDAINELMEDQVQTQRLISDIGHEAYLSEDMQTVTHTLYLKPKVYQENARAFLSIENPNNQYNVMRECSWNGATYWVRDTIPVADGYRFSFLLVNEYGYQEEIISNRDPGFGLLGTYAQFHLEPEDPAAERIKRHEATQRLTADEIYEFNAPIHTPHLFVKTAVAYRDITISLWLNGTEIWSKSYLDEFRSVLNGTASSLNGAACSLRSGWSFRH